MEWSALAVCIVLPRYKQRVTFSNFRAKEPISAKIPAAGLEYE